MVYIDWAKDEVCYHKVPITKFSGSVMVESDTKQVVGTILYQTGVADKVLTSQELFLASPFLVYILNFSK